MKIAITGSPSTGKTTLTRNIITRFPNLVHLNVDARRIIRSMGYYNIDDIPLRQRQNFQLQYLAEKIKMEAEITDFITERSFIDIAAFWTLRDAVDELDSIKNQIVDKCKRLSKGYDLHIFLPFGVIPFEDDGYRSKNMNLHYTISDQISYYLKQWELPYIIIDRYNIEERIFIATEAIKNILQ